MNPLPPQAYTKDTLLKAYSWLMTQGPSIKEMSTTPDILVSLYLKATRDGDSALDRPSIQNFKSELKSLAGLMGQLDNKSGSPTQHSQQAQGAQQAPASQASASAPSGATSSRLSPPHQMPSMQGIPGNSALSELDPASRAMIHEVKMEFNLSCETEALRMLIKIGYSRCKTIL